jgi:hypothetical protein
MKTFQKRRSADNQNPSVDDSTCPIEAYCRADGVFAPHSVSHRKANAASEAVGCTRRLGGPTQCLVHLLAGSFLSVGKLRRFTAYTTHPTPIILLKHLNI